MTGVAVVTGAAGGMGDLIVRRLHADGRRVLVTDLDEAAATSIATDLDPSGRTALGARLDITAREDYQAALDRAGSAFGTPSILVNNAAVTRAADPLAIGPEEFTTILATNTNSVLFGCQVFGPVMAGAGFGRIVNMASLAGQNGGTGTGAHYAASKGAILTLTKVFAKQFAGTGVTVNAVSPGPHDLPIVRRTVPAERLEQVISTIPVGHLGDAGFIADVVALLSADNAGFVTAACWDVNGGLFPR